MRLTLFYECRSEELEVDDGEELSENTDPDKVFSTLPDDVDDWDVQISDSFDDREAVEWAYADLRWRVFHTLNDGKTIFFDDREYRNPDQLFRDVQLARVRNKKIFIIERNPEELRIKAMTDEDIVALLEQEYREVVTAFDQGFAIYYNGRAFTAAKDLIHRVRLDRSLGKQFRMQRLPDKTLHITSFITGHADQIAGL